MPKKGFTLTELLVVIAIIGILGTTIVPVIGTAVDKARAAKIVALASTLETACDAYYSDVGNYGREWGSSAYSATTYHNLAMNSGITNWGGPYIKKPLASGDNPFNGSFVYLYNSFTTGGACSPGGFDLNGDGTADRTGAGNFVCFDNISQTNAQRINDMYDRGVGGTWTNSGKVRYQATGATGRLMVYISGG